MSILGTSELINAIIPTLQTETADERALLAGDLAMLSLDTLAKLKDAVCREARND